MKQKIKKHYINNKDLYKAIVDWIDHGRPIPVSNFLVESINEMIWRISTKSSFRNYTYLEEMKGEAMIHCLKALRTYKRDRDNPYGYFTTCIHHAFIQIIKKENKFVEFKFNMVQEKIDVSTKMDRSNIVGCNRNNNGDVINEYGEILTSAEELRKKRLY